MAAFAQLESIHHTIAVSLWLALDIFFYLYILKNIKKFWVQYCYKKC